MDYVSLRLPLKEQNTIHTLNFYMFDVVPSIHLSNAQNPSDIPLYCLVNRDPYNGLITMIPILLGSTIPYVQQVSRVVVFNFYLSSHFVQRNLRVHLKCHQEIAGY